MAYDLPGGRSDLDFPGDTDFSGDSDDSDDSGDLDKRPVDLDGEPVDLDGETVRDETEIASVEIGGEREATEGGEDDFDIGLLDEIERELAEVELALERLGDGSYGRCETCGGVLSEDELDAAPAGRFCRAHLPLDIS